MLADIFSMQNNLKAAEAYYEKVLDNVVSNSNNNNKHEKEIMDIKEKLISGLFFANPFNESENLGTDFYDEKLNKVKTVPYKDNYGYFFTSGPNTWHGMEKKEIKKERRCLQVNYVTFKTDWKVQS